MPCGGLSMNMRTGLKVSLTDLQACVFLCYDFRNYSLTHLRLIPWDLASFITLKVLLLFMMAMY